MISSAPVATDWSEWSLCSKDCGGGERGRTMTRVKGNAGDELCPTPGHQQFMEEREPCNTHVCPFWAEWESWSSCTKSCKTYPEDQPGTRQRSRECVGHVDEASTCSKIMSGGAQNEPCNTHVCPVECQWHSWGSWSACTQTCRKGQKMGTKIRTRKVKIQGKGTGAKCGSNSEESVSCECPVDGTWSNWTPSGECWNAQVILGCQDSNYYFLVGVC